MYKPNIIPLKYHLKEKTGAILPSAIILLYHRIGEALNYYNQLSVSAANFESHIAFLKKHHRIVALSEIMHQIENHQIESNCIALTFDDGYADNLHHALPILEKYKVPATFFITINPILNNTYLWWDLLEVILFIQTPTKEIRFTLKEALVVEELTKQNKANLFEKLSNLFKKFNKKELSELTSQLYLQVTDKKLLEPYRMLSPKELTSFSANPLVHIGSHTLDHTSLKSLPEIEIIEQLSESKKYLEQFTKYPIISLSYPYGTKEDYTFQIMNLVRDIGYKSGLSGIQQNIHSDCNILDIPRRYICDWNIQDFKNYIYCYLME